MPYFVILAFFFFLPILSSADSSVEATKKHLSGRARSQSGYGGSHPCKGEWMFSYRYMRMEMDGNRVNSRSINPEDIVTTEPNRFFGLPGQPPTLRLFLPKCLWICT